MTKAPNPRLLLVEGRDDLFVVAEVFEKVTGIPWEPSKERFLVDIDWCGDDHAVLERIGIRWKESGRKIVGIMIDADSSGSRWAQVRAHAPAEARASLPDELPSDGLVLDIGRDRRFGVWIMPDNQSRGMLETFLMRLRSSMPKELGDHVVSAMNQAKTLMEAHIAEHPDARPPVRPWKDVHADKAEMHTWLAWQDPPGLQLHEAVMTQLLDVQAPLSQTFVGWMKRLYDL
jgi:hypothetical protein